MSKPPAKRPCGSCPYRRDAPSGLWHESEYAKLPRFDLPMEDQPQGVFLCHQQDGHICAGWAGTHDMQDSLALKIALIMGWMTPEEVEETLDYKCPVPLFASGQEAADHGMRDILNPGDRAHKTRLKLLRTKDVQLGDKPVRRHQ